MCGAFSGSPERHTLVMHSDGTHHWYDCTKCDGIEYQMEEHTPKADVYEHDATNHWQVCEECGAKVDNTVVAHTYNDATCLTPKTCSVCGATDGEALGHDLYLQSVEWWDEYTPGMTTTVFVACNRDGCDAGDMKEIEVGANVSIEPTCTTPGSVNCSIPDEVEFEIDGKTYTVEVPRTENVGFKDFVLPATGHDYEVEWIWPETVEVTWGEDGAVVTAPIVQANCTCQNDTSHTDDHTAVVVQGEYVAPTCDTVGKVTFTASVTPENTEEHTKTFTSEKTYALDSMGHNFTGEYKSNGDGTHSRKCVNPGCELYGATQDCVSGSYKTDDTDHWKVCDLCKGEFDRAEHELKDANCTEPATCEVCGYTTGAALKHEWYHPATIQWTNAEDPTVRVRYHCIHCSYSADYTLSLSKNPDNFTITNADATCDKAGTVTYVAHELMPEDRLSDRMGQSYRGYLESAPKTVTTAEALGHKLTHPHFDWEIEDYSGYEAPGATVHMYVTCDVCGKRFDADGDVILVEKDEGDCLTAGHVSFKTTIYIDAKDGKRSELHRQPDIRHPPARSDGRP